jgi:hypothetical protein
MLYKRDLLTSMLPYCHALLPYPVNCEAVVQVIQLQRHSSHLCIMKTHISFLPPPKYFQTCKGNLYLLHNIRSRDPNARERVATMTMPVFACFFPLHALYPDRLS